MRAEDLIVSAEEVGTGKRLVECDNVVSRRYQ